MKKVLLKKLQSLTAILVLNALPVSFAQTSVGYEAEVLQTRAFTDERRNTLSNTRSPSKDLKQLYLDNALVYVQKRTEQPISYQHQMALALVEEAYQDDFDALLDHYEHELAQLSHGNDVDLIEATKRNVEDQLLALKAMRDAKIVEFNQQFSLS